jgi:hypothetical protein
MEPVLNQVVVPGVGGSLSRSSRTHCNGARRWKAGTSRDYQRTKTGNT